MKTETRKLYTFLELTDEAQERALEEWLAGETEYHWADEWKESLKGFEDVFPVKAKDWQVDPYRGSWVTIDNTWESPNVLDLEGIRAWKYLENHGLFDIARKEYCPFTGYCGDENLLDPVRAFRKNPRGSIRELMQDCVDSWASGFQADMEWQTSEEYARDHLENDDLEMYLENGGTA